MKTMLMAVLCTAAAAAFAQEATPDTWMSEAKSVRSRADAYAEVLQARASGELAQLRDPGYLPTIAQSKLRAEVVAELLRARESGELAVMQAEAHDFAAAPTGTAYASRGLLVAGQR
jgi:hypothetical protein